MFGFDEYFGEGGMCVVGCWCGKYQFGIGGQFDFLCLLFVIGEVDLVYFVVIFIRDDDIYFGCQCFVMVNILCVIFVEDY